MARTTSNLSTSKKSYGILSLLALLTAAMIIGQAYLLVKVIDGVFLEDETFQSLLPYLASLFLILAGRVLFSHLSGRKGIRMGAAKKQAYRRQLTNKYTRDPVQAATQGQSGAKVSMLMDAVDEVDSYYSQYIPQMFQATIIPLALIIVIFMTHANTGWIMLITTPFIPIFMIIIGMQTKKKSEEQLDALGAFSGRFLDVLQGLVTLKLFGRAREQKDVIEKSSNRFKNSTMDILKVAFTNSFMLELISMLSIGIIALEVALQLILFDGITFFTAFFVLLLAPEFYNALKELGSAFHNGKSSMGAVAKLNTELDKDEHPVKWGEETLKESNLPPHIALKSVTFHYQTGQFALRALDTDFSPRGNIAIVGPSGSGKSTLLHILSGLMAPTDGTVVVNGRSLSDYREDAWFGVLSYISQHPYVFSGTMAENIAMGAGQNASREDIARAAEQAGLRDFIESLELGLDTPIGEAGRGLSGGEKQRLALARAFLKQPSVILFDEPTTGLDLETEQILQASIKELAASATVITVAHRLHTIQDADQILYLEDGALIGSGTHTELLRDVPAYRDMVVIQEGGVSDE